MQALTTQWWFVVINTILRSLLVLAIWFEWVLVERDSIPLLVFAISAGVIALSMDLWGIIWDTTGDGAAPRKLWVMHLVSMIVNLLCGLALILLETNDIYGESRNLSLTNPVFNSSSLSCIATNTACRDHPSLSVDIARIPFGLVWHLRTHAILGTLLIFNLVFILLSATMVSWDADRYPEGRKAASSAGDWTWMQISWIAGLVIRGTGVLWILIGEWMVLESPTFILLLIVFVLTFVSDVITFSIEAWSVVHPPAIARRLDLQWQSGVSMFLNLLWSIQLLLLLTLDQYDAEIYDATVPPPSGYREVGTHVVSVPYPIMFHFRLQALLSTWVAFQALYAILRFYAVFERSLSTSSYVSPSDTQPMEERESLLENPTDDSAAETMTTGGAYRRPAPYL